MSLRTIKLGFVMCGAFLLARFAWLAGGYLYERFLEDSLSGSDPLVIFAIMAIAAAAAWWLYGRMQRRWSALRQQHRLFGNIAVTVAIVLYVTTLLLFQSLWLVIGGALIVTAVGVQAKRLEAKHRRDLTAYAAGKTHP